MDYRCLAHGVAHQIRVHLQYLGYPIANDPLYSHENIWGSHLGRGGVELAAPEGNGESSQAAAIAARQGGNAKLEDRENGDIDVTSPIRLSQQAKDIIAKLRRARDAQEDWVK